MQPTSRSMSMLIRLKLFRLDLLKTSRSEETQHITEAKSNLTVRYFIYKIRDIYVQPNVMIV